MQQTICSGWLSDIIRIVLSWLGLSLARRTRKSLVSIGSKADMQLARLASRPPADRRRFNCSMAPKLRFGPTPRHTLPALCRPFQICRELRSFWNRPPTVWAASFMSDGSERKLGLVTIRQSLSRGFGIRAIAVKSLPAFGLMRKNKATRMLTALRLSRWHGAGQRSPN